MYQVLDAMVEYVNKNRHIFRFAFNLLEELHRYNQWPSDLLVQYLNQQTMAYKMEMILFINLITWLLICDFTIYID